MQKYIAELLGTFGLTLAVLLSINGDFPVPTPVIAALTLGLFVYTIGHISGAHLNPAVTIGLLTVKKISCRDAAWYIVVQFIGAGFAMAFGRFFITNPVLASMANETTVGVFEFVGMFFFAFGIAAVVFGKVSSSLSGLVVGMSLLLGISFASFESSGILNPAVAFGIGSFSIGYIIGPVIGSIIAMCAFRCLSNEK